MYAFAQRCGVLSVLFLFDDRTMSDTVTISVTRVSLVGPRNFEMIERP